MKYLLITLLFLATIPAYSQFATGYETQQKEKIVSMGVSEDGKRIKVKYELDYSNNPCISCGIYIHDGYNWRWTYSGKDEDGYYVQYYGVKYYF